MSSSSPAEASIFISYSHDTPFHMQRVLSFAKHLRDLNLSCGLDQDVDSPANGWPRWTQHRIEEAEHVLVVCTETYRRRFEGKEEDGGRGVNWEAVIVTNFLYESRVASRKFIPIVFAAADAEHIPIVLRGPTFYDVTVQSDYEALIRRLSQGAENAVSLEVEPLAAGPPAYQPPGAVVAFAPPSAVPTSVVIPATFAPPVSAGAGAPGLVVDAATVAPAAGQPADPATVPHNLPDAPTALIGREMQINQWHELLLHPETQLLTIVGFGGIGKTRAALELARRSLGHFAHGVWWVELADTRNRDDMIHRIAHDLRLPLQPGPVAHEQVASYLRGRSALLVLDNTEQIVDAAASTVTELLREAPDVKFLVTTRHALNVEAERQVEVPPLSEAEAHALFVDRAAARQSDFSVRPEDHAIIAEICRQLEGVPLAINLAAARTVMLEPAEILERLSERFELLKTKGTHVPARQQALSGAIEWSYDLLSPAHQSLFAQLSVFAGSFRLDDAEAVCDTPDALEDVEELRAHSMLRVHTDSSGGRPQKRFILPTSLKAYAADKLQSEFVELVEPVHRRHAEHFLKVAEKCLSRLHTADETVALSQFENSLNNIVAAHTWFTTAAQLEPSARLALALGRFLHRRSRLPDARRYLEAGLQAVERLEGVRWRAELLLERASVHLDEFEWPEARALATSARSLLDGSTAARGMATAHNVLGLAAWGERNVAAARESFQAALEQGKQARDDVVTSAVLNNLGVLESQGAGGDREAGARFLQEALLLRRQQRDQRGIAEASTNLGVLAQKQGHRETAQEAYTEAVQILTELKNISGVGITLYNLADVQQQQGHQDKAYRLAAAAACLLDKVASPYEPYAAKLLRHTSLELGYSPNDVEAVRSSLRDKALAEVTSWALQTVPPDEEQV